MIHMATKAWKDHALDMCLLMWGQSCCVPDTMSMHCLAPCLHSMPPSYSGWIWYQNRWSRHSERSKGYLAKLLEVSVSGKLKGGVDCVESDHTCCIWQRPSYLYKIICICFCAKYQYANQISQVMQSVGTKHSSRWYREGMALISQPQVSTQNWCKALRRHSDIHVQRSRLLLLWLRMASQLAVFSISINGKASLYWVDLPWRVRTTMALVQRLLLQ